MSDTLLRFVREYGPQAGEEGPVRFVREVLGVEPDDWQLKVLRAYGRGERRISIRSAHGVGKTAVAAWCAVHQLICRFPQRIACTAPTKGQLYDALFSEIKFWLKKLPEPLLQVIDLKSDKIELLLDPEGSYITARTARRETPEALQGIHSPGFVLLIADEASGIHEAIFEAAVGSMSGHNATTLLLSNPVRTQGFFFETHNKLADSWFTMHVAAQDSPRVSDDFIKQVRDTYGEESNAYRVRVLGEFPLADDDTIIPYELVEMAKIREVSVNENAPVVWGLDVARFGMDATALVKRQANIMLEPVRRWRGLDTMQVCGVVKAEWESVPGHKRPQEICVDVIGLGSGVVDRLREMGLPVIGVNVSETPALAPERFANLRTELWFQAREWFSRRDCYIIDDTERENKNTLSSELVRVKYKIIDSNGKMRAESKDDMKRRGFASPDAGDAFVLTFAGNAGRALGVAPSNWGKPLHRRIKGVV